MAALVLALAVACAPIERPAGPPVTQPALASDVLVMADGARLALRVWRPAGVPRAVVLALHGFNDYGHAFENAGVAFADGGVATYAYDQRGFGANPVPGLWPGTATLAADARQAFALIAARHPGVPVYVLGESMGGAVALLAFADAGAPGTNSTSRPAGLILSAPALWGWSTLNPLYKATLWLVSHVAPGSRFSGRGLDIQASDNIPMLQALAADPLFIKETRADAVWGLVHAMDDALAARPPAGVPTLMLYGANDQVIPSDPTRAFARRLGPGQRFAYYTSGWHLLLRDLAANVVLGDLLAWIDDPEAPLPSGADGAALMFVSGT
ncbi:MAG: lysophospholipase [Alphaproteobacteria bacterium]